MHVSEIYDNVVSAMQDAEEIGGPEGKDYVTLMNAIIAEATSRRDTFLALQKEDE